MNDFEKNLANYYGKKNCVYTGNGTTAMYIAFKALNRQDKKVLFPAISCTNPVNAAYYAGYEVDFCDVNLKNFTMNIDMFRELLEEKDYGIVVPTHIYGNKCDMDSIHELCRNRDIVIMEDAAQTYEVSKADISIISFGHTKMFETPDGGGIVLVEDDELARRMEEIRDGIKDKDVNYERQFDEYRNRYYAIIKSNDSDALKNKNMRRLQKESKDIFVFDNKNSKRNETQIIDALQNKKEVLVERKRKKELYDELLDSEYVRKAFNSDYLWRYSFLYSGDRESLLSEVRKQGIDISSWYPSLSEIYKDEVLPNALVVQNQVVNLWVSKEHSIEQIKKEIEVINEILRKKSK